MTTGTRHPDCQTSGPHRGHELASPGGAKPGSWCDGEQTQAEIDAQNAQIDRLHGPGAAAALDAAIADGSIFGD